MFEIFDNLLLGKEVEYAGKTYLRLSHIQGDLITAVEKDAPLPAPVVVIKAPNQPTKANEE